MKNPQRKVGGEMNQVAEFKARLIAGLIVLVLVCLGIIIVGVIAGGDTAWVMLTIGLSLLIGTLLVVPIWG